MDPVNIPTSFIPKRPVIAQDVITRPHSRTVGILSVIAVAAVVATAVAFAGVYLYGNQLANEKIALEKRITAAKDGLGTDFVSDMKRLNSRIEGVKMLIKNHIVVSPIFAALQKTTLQSVQYSNFEYTFATDASGKTQIVAVKITGTAKNYATIALQSDAFAQAAIIKNPIFSNLTIDDKTQRIGFNLNFTVNPSDLSYQSFIDANIKAGTATGSNTTLTTPPILIPAESTTTPVAPAPTPVVSPSTAPASQPANTAPKTPTSSPQGPGAIPVSRNSQSL